MHLCVFKFLFMSYNASVRLLMWNECKVVNTGTCSRAHTQLVIVGIIVVCGIRLYKVLKETYVMLLGKYIFLIRYIEKGKIRKSQKEEIRKSQREEEREKMHGFTSISSKEGDGDIESGILYPGLSHGENQLRWGFIRKVYGILAAQMILTTVVSSVTVLYSPVNDLLRGNSGLLLLLLFLPLILLWPLYVYQQKHPLNLVLLGLWTSCLSLTVGVSCANTDGKIVLEALILTSAVVSSLTAYTFWASKKGKDFSYLGPILFTSLIILLLTSFIQMFFPLGSTSTAVYGGISAIVFSGYIVYDTDNLIKRFTYDQYIWATVTLYLDILNLFLSILRMLRQGDS